MKVGKRESDTWPSLSVAFSAASERRKEKTVITKCSRMTAEKQRSSGKLESRAQADE